MFGLIEVKNRDINLVFCGENKQDVLTEMKNRFAREIERFGFTVEDIKTSQRLNCLCDKDITTGDVEEAAKQLVEMAEENNLWIDGDYSDGSNFAWYYGGEAQITVVEDEYTWKIVDTNGQAPEELGDFSFILDYIKGCEEIFGTTAIQQLRALWTAFCIRRNIDVDTDKYDRLINEMWLHLLNSTGTHHAKNKFEKFDNFMCEYLV